MPSLLLPEMTFPSPLPLPPIITPPALTRIPSAVLPRSSVPFKSVPIQLPRMTEFVPSVEDTSMPSLVLPEMMLRALLVLPPTKVNGALMRMPSTVLATAAFVTPKPMTFPMMELLTDESPPTVMPLWLFPEMKFRFVEPSPPMMLAEALVMSTPFWPVLASTVPGRLSPR